MLADPERYFDRLNAYRDGDINGIVAYVAAATTTAASEATVTAQRLAALP